MPPALRLLAIPLLGAWALWRWELDGRPPHRALLGLAAWWLRPRVLAAGAGCPRSAPSSRRWRRSSSLPTSARPSYPRGRVDGPARLLLRYPVAARRGGRTLRLRRRPGPALHKGHVLEVAAGHAVVFEEGQP